MDSSLKTKSCLPTVTQHKPATVKDKTLVKIYKRIAIYATGITKRTNVCRPTVLLLSPQRTQQRNLLLLATAVKLTRKISAQVASGVKQATTAIAPVRATARTIPEIVQAKEASQFADATGTLTKMLVKHKLLV